jgi:hypothetical protein
MAWRRGDFSGQYRHAQLAFAVADGGKRFFPELAMGRALRATGHYPEARRIWHHYPLDDRMWRMWNGEAPSGREVEGLLRDPIGTWTDEAANHFLLRSLMNAGRAREVAQLYDRRFSSPEMMAAAHPTGHVSFVGDSVVVALALRQAGRGAEADRLLALADAAARRRLARGRVPRWYLADCAAIWAALGRRDQALSALERAVGLGWYYAGILSLGDIGDEPAFRSLRGEPRFERIRATFKAHIERERLELGPV